MAYIRQSIKLLLARCEADTVSGIADAIVKVPGTVGDSEARTIEGGEGWFQSPTAGDYLTIKLMDDDDILGNGAGFVLDTFHDTDVDIANQGWYFPSGHPLVLHPVVSDNPTALPAGMYLHIYGHKNNLADSDTLYVNIHWGRRII